MNLLPNILFCLLLVSGIGCFAINAKKLIRNIRLGKNEKVSDNKRKRRKNMIRIALGQGKMTVRPVAGILHIFVYLGFIIINFEMLEIVLDGILGTHETSTIVSEEKISKQNEQKKEEPQTRKLPTIEEIQKRKKVLVHILLVLVFIGVMY